MPLYDYRCDGCGPFREWRGMAMAGDPCACPACDQPATRVVAAPHTRGGSAAVRYKAEARNERSAHEPAVMKHMGRKNADKERHGHARHSHHGSHSHVHRSNRPWMVGH